MKTLDLLEIKRAAAMRATGLDNDGTWLIMQVMYGRLRLIPSRRELTVHLQILHAGVNGGILIGQEGGLPSCPWKVALASRCGESDHAG
jgi:hypothetical protein